MKATYKKEKKAKNLKIIISGILLAMGIIQIKQANDSINNLGGIITRYGMAFINIGIASLVYRWKGGTKFK